MGSIHGRIRAMFNEVGDTMIEAGPAIPVEISGLSNVPEVGAKFVVLEDEKITLIVPIHYSGQETAIGVKEQGGEVAILVSDVEVSCLPKDLPEFLEVDISELELNQRMGFSDISAPEGVEILALANDQDHSIVTINPPRKEEEDDIPELEADTIDGEDSSETTEDKPDESGSEETKD